MTNEERSWGQYVLGHPGARLRARIPMLERLEEYCQDAAVCASERHGVEADTFRDGFYCGVNR